MKSITSLNHSNRVVHSAYDLNTKELYAIKMPNPNISENLSQLQINDLNKRKFRKEFQGYELIKQKNLEDCFTKVKFADE